MVRPPKEPSMGHRPFLLSSLLTTENNAGHLGNTLTGPLGVERIDEASA